MRMPRFFHSLRFKLVAMFLAVFGAIQLVLGAAGLIARERYLQEHFDQELIQRARSMAVQLIREGEPFSDAALSRVIDGASKAVHFREFYVQLRDAQGRVIERSDNLGVYHLPWNPAAAPPQDSGRRWLQTIQGQAVERLVGRGGKLRIVTLYVREGPARPLYLQVGASLARVDESTALLRTIFVTGIPVGLLTAAAASWLVMGRAIRRINEVARVAHQLTPQRLTSRLDPPATQDELGRMIAELNEMLDRLEAGYRAQERFIHDVSHELKTPIAVLLSESQVMRLTRPNEADHRRFMASVEEEMRRLGRLVDSLLTLARVDGHSGAARRQRVWLPGVIADAVEQCAPIAAARGARVALTLPGRRHPPEEGPCCLGDAELLGAMVGNLIRNAIGFSPPGQAVQVELSCHDQQAVIRVCDRGPGIPSQEIDRIFDRFVQASNNRGRRGAGLGLAIARSVAQFHQGRITAQNMPEGGSCFTVFLPLIRAAALPAATPLQPVPPRAN
ncbi:MAG TPA: ATP-binding protein [Phycisphaeraceae bacterium]